jgi:putative spermidine/putrescine transport system substrate-binding protein
MEVRVRFAILLSAAASLSLTNSALAAEKISYVTSGGVYLENIKKAFLEPIGKKLDVEWTIETSDNDTQVRVQVASNNVTYDIVEFGASVCALGASQGLYEKLDYSVINNKDLAPGSFSDYYVGSTVFSIVLAWNSKTVGANPPQSWADFWNTEKFPGNRSLRKTARAMLEAALMADGVQPEKVYPIDMDRAFASLRKIKSKIKAWWLSGAESQQFMKEGGIDMIGAFNARMDSVAKDGAPVTYTFNQGILDFGCWAVVKGSKHRDLAMKILAEFVKPEYQAEMSRLSNYGAANTKILETGKISPELAKKLPTAPDNLRRQIFANPDWWIAHGTEANERFDQFMAE